MLETRQKSTVRMKVVSLIHHMLQFFGPFFFYTTHMTRTQSADFQKSVALQHISEIK